MASITIQLATMKNNLQAYVKPVMLTRRIEWYFKAIIILYSVPTHDSYYFLGCSFLILLLLLWSFIIKEFLLPNLEKSLLKAGYYSTTLFSTHCPESEHILYSLQSAWYGPFDPLNGQHAGISGAVCLWANHRHWARLKLIRDLPSTSLEVNGTC